MDKSIRVLFISSGNSKIGISSIIKAQGESLRKQGVDLTYFTIKGKGIKGYLKNIKPLRIFLKENDFDIIHAHYSMSAFVASLAGAKPLVVSLMGSDVKSDRFFKFFIKLFNRFSWSKIIVKSEDMKRSLGIRDVSIIPNGVDFDRYKPMNQDRCKKELDWDLTKKHVLFAANPERAEKNFNLAKEAVELLNDSNTELKVLIDVPNDKMPLHHNAADVVLLTSLWEGSPNVIKEAMACNRPIVSSDVGDVKKIIGTTDGCFVNTFDKYEVRNNIAKAIAFNYSTNGRNNISYLQSEIISEVIIELYKASLENNY
jgi:glycosyltransferase involved in cell wall biosynthesis